MKGSFGKISVAPDDPRLFSFSYSNILVFFLFFFKRSSINLHRIVCFTYSCNKRNRGWVSRRPVSKSRAIPSDVAAQESAAKVRDVGDPFGGGPLRVVATMPCLLYKTKVNEANGANPDQLGARTWTAPSERATSKCSGHYANSVANESFVLARAPPRRYIGGPPTCCWN